MRKIVFPQESNLQPLDYRSTALPLELEKTPPRMLNLTYYYNQKLTHSERYSDYALTERRSRNTGTRSFIFLFGPPPQQ